MLKILPPGSCLSCVKRMQWLRVWHKRQRWVQNRQRERSWLVFLGSRGWKPWGRRRDYWCRLPFTWLTFCCLANNTGLWQWNGERLSSLRSMLWLHHLIKYSKKPVTLPYSVLVIWSGLLVKWVVLGLGLGPGDHKRLPNQQRQRCSPHL